MPNVILKIDPNHLAHMSEEDRRWLHAIIETVTAEHMLVLPKQVIVEHDVKWRSHNAPPVELVIQFSTGKHRPDLPENWDDTDLRAALYKELKTLKANYKGWWTKTAIWTQPIPGGHYTEE